MAEANYTQAWSQIKARIDIFDELEQFCQSAVTNFIDLESTLKAAAIYENGEETIASASSDRTALSGLLSPGNVLGGLAGPLLDMAQALEVPERDAIGITQRLIDSMIAAGDTINSRDMTYGAPVAGGANAGDGSLKRLTVGEGGYDLEHCHGEVKTFKCIRDQNRSDKHEEVFEATGVEAQRDLLKVAGSGLIKSMKALSARDTETLLTNPSFTRISGTQPATGAPVTPSSLTSITGWVISGATGNVELDVDTTYRGFVGDTETSLRLKDNETIAQSLSDNRAPSIDPTPPYYFQVAVYREASCDGNLTVSVGASSQVFAVSGLVNGAWNIVNLDLDKDLYYRGFREDSLSVSLQLSGRTTGTIFLDDIIWAPMTFIDGTYWAIIGGSAPFIEEDVFTATDAESGTRGVIQYWFWRAGLSTPYSLPSITGGTETITDP